MRESVSIQQSDQWSSVLSTVVHWIWAGLSWIVEWQAVLVQQLVHAKSFWAVFANCVLLLPPVLVLVAGVWGTMVALYTLPFRLGRSGVLLMALLMSWWDVLRMVWFYWAGLARLLVVLLGWAWGLLRLGIRLLWGALKGVVMSPIAMLDAISRRPGVPWGALIVLIFWSALEATIFTATLRPTMTELLTDLTGSAVNQAFLVPILWIFLLVLIAGSFACVQVLNEAIATRQFGQIISMVLVEFAVALFEVLFLYRELVDAITPWLAQQGFILGVFGTIGLSLFAWVGVRGMTWFLFGRFGTPALIGLLGRTALGEAFAIEPVGAGTADFWTGLISAFKVEREWFKQEGQEIFALMSLPILQLLAAGFNFGVVFISGRPHFALPFRSLDDVLQSTRFTEQATVE
jgi:hypothetical protein